MKLLFFIESMQYGGKERLLIELLNYLKEHTQHELMVVLTKKDIQYAEFLELKIPFVIIERKYLKKDPILFFKFFNLCRKFRPDIIHTLGNMVSFYSLFAVILLKIPLVNNQISSAPKKINRWSFDNFITKINFIFSKIIISNSKAGLDSFKVHNKKSIVIYNGVHLDRFSNLTEKEEIRKKYGIKTTYAVLMVASFSDMKDHDRFIDIAKKLNNQRDDISFVAVGNGNHFERIIRRVDQEKIPNMVFTGRINDLESMIAACDIGALFSPNGEGISCTITEYMALGKPVIANDTGGNKEIVKHGVNGYLVNDETPEEIADLISNLINDAETRRRMGEAGKNNIEENFTIDKMGKTFDSIYNEINQRRS